MGETGGAGEKIFVSVRLRPLNGREIVTNDVSDWECFSDDTIVYKNASLNVPERSMYPSAYTFDRVFGYDASTRQVYQDGAKDVVLSVVSGINASIFAYGQTSSGKTFTMTGITEYTLADIYDYVQKHPDRVFHLKFSAMEIYNESVRDLLSNDDYPLRLLDDPERGTVVENITEETVRDWDHVMELLSVCEAQRQIGDTSLNETSSRSHQIIRLTVKSQPCNYVGRDSASTLVSTVNFVDLAGSERASQSLTAGTRLKEGGHINRSLLTLGTVIRKLSKGKNEHIPFRDSKLTRILQSSLGGNSRTAIICTMSPARSHVENSRNTLLFASCAKEVSTNAQVNTIMSDKTLVKHLKRELDRLENELKTPVSTPDANAMLCEKDNQIKMMKNQIDELIAERDDLIAERDYARSQVQELLRVIEDDENSTLGPEEYPHLRVQVSTEAEIYMPDTSSVVDPRKSFDGSIGSSQYSPRQSESSFDENYIQVTEFEVNSHPNTSPIRPMIRIAPSSETDSCHDWDDDEIDEKSNRNSDDLTDYIPKAYVESYSSSPDTKLNDDHNDEDQEVVNSPFKEDETVQLELSSVNEDDHVQQNFKLPKSRSYHESTRAECVNKVENNNNPPNGDEQYYTGRPLGNSTKSCTFNCGVEFEKSNINHTDKEPENKIPAEENDTSVKSSLISETKQSENKIPAEEDDTSVKSSLISETKESENKIPAEEDDTSLQSSLISQTKESESKIPAEEDDTSVKSSLISETKESENKIPAEEDDTSVKCSLISETKESENKIPAEEDDKSVKSSLISQTKEFENKIPAEEDDTSVKSSLISQTKESETQNDNRIEDTQVTSTEVIKSVKDIGSDPIEDCSRSTSSSWPSEFKKLQKELIELWHECNAPLVHRSYFFLLFKGDQSDSIYMEVERRRLAFVKDMFARGKLAVEDGRSVTRSSTEKALRREREMLTKQMQKKLSEHERESLFQRWGIKRDAKYRRVQLANKLWSRVDMDHVADSAAVVAKLVELPGHAPKEMFGLNFTAPSSRKTYSFRNLIPLL